MFNLNIKSLTVLIACMCLFMAASCVSASEINDMTCIDDADSNDALEISQNQIDEEKLAENNIGTFEELNDDIKNLNPGDIYYFDKDYAFDEQTNMSSCIIDITADNVKIEGKYHTIDASGVNGAMFKVSGNNVVIKDLIFTNFISNSQNDLLSSPITWTGDNGKLQNTEFYNTAGVNGGAICWTGDNGIITSCFSNSTSALGKGGAIFVGGNNNKIEFSTFLNFDSSLDNEAIYVSKKNENPTTLNIEGCFFTYDDSDEVTEVAVEEGCTAKINGLNFDNGDYNELCYDLENLKPGDYYNIVKDYEIANPKGDLERNRIINIRADNVVINGNGHKIDARDGANFFAIFNITGNNVTILNLVIINSEAYDKSYISSGKNIYGDEYNHLISPIEWNGDHGVISNCIFMGNTGYHGGAIYWNANNGIIENCIFDDNAADLGGSIFINGTNNIIRNCKFKDSYSYWNFESIYLTTNSKPQGDLDGLLIVNNCTFENIFPSSKDICAEEGCIVLYDSVNPETALDPDYYMNLIEDLKNLKDNEVYTLNHDYYVNDDFGLIAQITANNVTINGNGHYIFGKDPLSALLYVYGNGVKINNLIIDLSNENVKSQSFIRWRGDDGELTNCTLTGGSSEEGGALSWSGNNGIVNNCLFTENIATFGGAIYINGANMTLTDCTFINSIAKTTGDSIYYTDGSGLLTITNCNFDSAKLWIADDSDVIIDGKYVPKTFSELYDDLFNLKENEVYDIYRDYLILPSMGLTILANNTVINGNKHLIYANTVLLSSVFIVLGNNVTISNLYLNNSNHEIGKSFIIWTGDNGVFTDSVLIGNVAENGGAIFWNGNNGLIDDCIFLQNSADFGGAIYIEGSYNKISNSIFLQTGSRLSGEAIYIGSERKKITLENIFWDELTGGFVDSTNIKIDLKYVYELIYETQFADEYININPLIYISITKGGINYYNENVYYYCQYDDATGEFVFTLNKEFKEYDIIYSKDYRFKNIINYTFDDVYAALYNGDYENTFALSKTVYVSSQSDYTDALQIFKSLDAFNPIYNFFNNDISLSKLAKDFITYQLNVQFTKYLVIDCDSTWDLSSSPFHKVYMDGNESVILGSFKDRDEDKFIRINEDEYNEKLLFVVTNMIIEGFNTAVENFGGECILYNVIFNENEMDYWIDRDWGAAILNTGVVICVDCVFTNNYAKNGGAIFNQGYLVLENCTFYNNDAYGKGDDVCVGDGGQVIIDGVNITGDNSIVYFAESLSALESGLLSMLAVGITVVSSTIIGLLSSNPVLGISAGVAIGSLVGAGFASLIISKHYDVNYNRANIIAILMAGCAISGGLAGYLGSDFRACVDNYIAFINEVGADGIFITSRVNIALAIKVGIAILTIPPAIMGVATYVTD